MDLAAYSFEILTFLFVIAIIAGFIDTLVGGGGLLAVPALLLSGIPPIYVLGTNKFQGSMGTCLLYTSDAADDTPCVDLGGRRII